MSPGSGVPDAVDGAMTRSEADEARRLAEALDGRPSPEVDPESLAVARLLAAVAGQEDEVGARRLRRRLVAEAGARHLLLRSRVQAAAAAAVVLLAVGIAPRLRPSPDASLLAAREAVARASLAGIASPRDPLTAQSRELGSTVVTRLASERFDRLRTARELRVLGDALDVQVSRVVAEAPGGRS